MRSLLILGSAVALYIAMAWVLSDDTEYKTVLAVEQRMDALEESLAQAGKEGRGTLFRLLVLNPDLGQTLLAGWTSQRLTSEMGWPDSVEGVVWTYAPRLSSGESLRVTVGASMQVVVGVEVLPPSSSSGER
ncbi:MAG: hypothetical protein GY930_12020 [bacterium]|nr:hypothetical protein [bacterium]